MSARGELVFMVALLSSVLASSIKESGENLSEQAECRGACSLARDKTSKAGVKVLRALSCYDCLNRRKGKTWRQERIKDRLFFTSTTFTKRHRRSLFLDPSLPMSSTAPKPSDCVGSSDDKSVPEIVKPSKVDVTFGKYESTSYWYVNVSWTPLDDSSGHLYGTMLGISINAMRPVVICTVLRLNQTFLNINISFYGYSYPESINLLIHGLPYRKKLIRMTSYKPRIPTSSNLPTLTSTTGIPTSFTLYTLTGKTASDSGGLASSSSSTSPTTTFSSSVSTVTNEKSSANHTIKYVFIATGILVGLLLVLGFLKYIFVYIRRRKRSRVLVLEVKERPFWMGRLLQFLQVPEDSDNQDAVTGQEKNTNNRRDSRSGRRINNTFVRLSSTSSNESAVFFV